jgi:hypothetical protein
VSPPRAAEQATRPTVIPAGHWLPRRFAACQRTVVTRSEPHPTRERGSFSARCEPHRSHRPCHPHSQAAVTSGIQRTVTVTPRGPLSGPSAPDQGERSRPKLHGMQGVRGSNPLSCTTGQSHHPAPFGVRLD